MSTFPGAGSRPSGNLFFTYRTGYGRKIPIGETREDLYTPQRRRERKVTKITKEK